MLGLALSAGEAAARAQTLPGPVPAVVERVIDGDTFVARVRIWLSQDLVVAVRLRDIDAPELRTGCAAERAKAVAAKRFLEGLLADGRVSLSRIGGGKYHGRVLADATASDGREIGPALLQAGLARPYSGGRREAWC